VLAGGCPPRPGVRELLADLAASGVRIAVATTGSRAWVEPLLAGIPVAAEAVVTGDDVSRLKPDPESYLLALRRLGLRAEEALAVEDSAPGLRAALAAGLATVVVTNGYTRDHDLTGAALVRRTFDGLTTARLRAVHEHPPHP
jgi:HAD superfamily hydrolase (TIGR01509 family)